jgi:hypothetical protein
MKCLFCKQNSEYSISVEHIIPESLGNKDHILSKGIVCDGCNQYFAVKVEKPLLEQQYFKNVRHRAGIESKKGRIPFEKVIILGKEIASAELTFGKNNSLLFNSDDEEKLMKAFSGKKGSMIIPIVSEPEKDNKALSRFLAKAAVEVLLYKFIYMEGWLEEVMNHPQLEDLKKYARYGAGVNFWPYHQRRIYTEETRFNDPKIRIENYEVLHEFTILITRESEYYFVLAIMGIEYTLNIAGPELEGYHKWLEENPGKSPLDDPNEQKIIQ